MVNESYIELIGINTIDDLDGLKGFIGTIEDFGSPKEDNGSLGIEVFIIPIITGFAVEILKKTPKAIKKLLELLGYVKKKSKEPDKVSMVINIEQLTINIYNESEQHITNQIEKAK